MSATARASLLLADGVTAERVAALLATAEDVELLVPAAAAAALSEDARVLGVPTPPARAAFLRAAARRASSDLCVAVGRTTHPRPGWIEPLARALDGATIASPVIETVAGDVRGYRREADGSLWPVLDPACASADAFSLDFLAARPSFFAELLPDLTAADGHYETLVAKAAEGRLALAADARAVRVSAGPAVTVAVCTHDQAQEIGPCLDALVAAGATMDGCEVIVVDNASTDDTPTVVAERVARHGAGIRVLQEAILGLSRARNVALAAARGDVVAYLDDDARPAPGWLEALRATFADPAVAVVGGPIHALWPPTRPAGWPGPDLERYFTVLSLGDAPLDFEQGDFYGANWSCRTACARRVGGFDEELGWTGDGGIPAEETSLAGRLAEAALGTHRWAPDAGVGHRIGEARVDENWVVHRSFRQGCASPLVTGDGPIDLEEVALACRSAASRIQQVVPLQGVLGLSAALNLIAGVRRPLDQLGATADSLGVLAACGRALGAQAVPIGHTALWLGAEEGLGSTRMPRLGRRPGHTGSGALRVLVACSRVPVSDGDAASARVYRIVELLCSSGHHVTLVAPTPASDGPIGPVAVALLEHGVELIAGDAQRQAPTFVADRPWDAVWLFSAEVAAAYGDMVHRALPASPVLVDLAPGDDPADVALTLGLLRAGEIVTTATDAGAAALRTTADAPVLVVPPEVEADTLTALLQPPALDVRAATVLAFADELVADPALLEAYCSAVRADDPVTLVIVAGGDDLSALSERVGALDPDAAPDMLAVDQPDDPAPVVARAAALLSRRSAPGYERLPRIEAHEAGPLRSLLGLERAA